MKRIHKEIGSKPKKINAKVTLDDNNQIDVMTVQSNFKLCIRGWLSHKGRNAHGHWHAYRRDYNSVTYKIDDETITLAESKKIKNNNRVTMVLLERRIN